MNAVSKASTMRALVLVPREAFLSVFIVVVDLKETERSANWVATMNKYDHPHPF